MYIIIDAWRKGKRVEVFAQRISDHIMYVWMIEKEARVMDGLGYVKRPSGSVNVKVEGRSDRMKAQPKVLIP